MTGKRELKKAALREKLLEVATARIAAHGFPSLRLRDLADDAGCALGGLYNFYADLDELVLRVGVQTLARLATAAERAVAGVDDPVTRLHILARTYSSFARDNRLLWRALFEHRLAEGRAVPQWYAEPLAALMARIAEPLEVIVPGLRGEALMIRARTMFSAVHGAVSISLDSRFAGLPVEVQEAELVALVDVLVKGSSGPPHRFAELPQQS